MYKKYKCEECGGFCELKINCNDPKGALPSNGCPAQCAIAKWGEALCVEGRLSYVTGASRIGKLQKMRPPRRTENEHIFNINT